MGKFLIILCIDPINAYVLSRTCGRINPISRQCCDPDSSRSIGVLIGCDELNVTPASLRNWLAMLIGNLEKDGQGGAGTQRARFPCRRVPDANLYLRDGAVLFLGTGKGKVCSLIPITFHGTFFRKRSSTSEVEHLKEIIREINNYPPMRVHEFAIQAEQKYWNEHEIKLALVDTPNTGPNGTRHF